MAEKDHRGFTLIEILTVIAIIGILGTILFPAIGQAMDKSRRMKDISNLRQIAMAYINYTHNSSSKNEINSCQSVYEIANLFAKTGYLTNPEIYYSDFDYLAPASRKEPKFIGQYHHSQWIPNKEFSQYPLSVVIITNISPSANATTTPIVYTRGLNHSTGKWKDQTGKDGGVYKNNGGYIVFLDGHVKFFSNLTDDDNKLVSFYTGNNTSDIKETVNHGAKALSHLGIEWESGN